MCGQLRWFVASVLGEWCHTHGLCLWIFKFAFFSINFDTNCSSRYSLATSRYCQGHVHGTGFRWKCNSSVHTISYPLLVYDGQKQVIFKHMLLPVGPTQKNGTTGIRTDSPVQRIGALIKQTHINTHTHTHTHTHTRARARFLGISVVPADLITRMQLLCLVIHVHTEELSATVLGGLLSGTAGQSCIFWARGNWTAPT